MRPLSESAIQREVIAVLEQCGYVVVRNHAGRLRFNGAWLRLAPEGFPDLTVIANGCRFLEVKGPTGKLSPEQEKMHERIRRAGGVVAVVRSATEALEVVRNG